MTDSPLAGFDTTIDGVQRSNDAVVKAFQSLIAKAQTPQALPDPMQATINIIFDGAGQALTVGMGGMIQIPYPCRIMAVTMYAGIPSTVSFGMLPVTATASIVLGLSFRGQWASGAFPLYGGGAPSLVAAAEQEIDIVADGWITNLQPGDLITYALSAFDATNTATWLMLALWVRKLDLVGVGISDVVDGGAQVTDSGDPVTNRG